MEASETRIEEATEDDIPAMARLLGILFAQEADFSPDTSRQETGLRSILNAPETGRVFVARQGADILGMVSVLFTISTASGGRACLLEDMIVHPSQRGSGLGTKLLECAIDFAHQENFGRITLLTDRDNASAIRFYQRQGFSESAMTVLRRDLS